MNDPERSLINKCELSEKYRFLTFVHSETPCWKVTLITVRIASIKYFPSLFLLPILIIHLQEVHSRFAHLCELPAKEQPYVAFYLFIILTFKIQFVIQAARAAARAAEHDDDASQRAVCGGRTATAPATAAAQSPEDQVSTDWWAISRCWTTGGTPQFSKKFHFGAPQKIYSVPIRKKSPKFPLGFPGPRT